MVASSDLSACPALRELPPAVLESLARRARPIEFRRHDRLLALGEYTARLLFLLRGYVRLVAHGRDGETRTLDVYGPGELIGLRGLFDTGDVWCEAVALTAGRGAEISKRDVLYISRSQPELMLTLARACSRRVVHLNERLMLLMSETVPIRVGRTLLELADGDGSEGLVPLAVPLTHELLAELVGASRPHTSIVLKDLERQGAVQCRKPSGLLVHLSRLQEITHAAP